MNGQTPEARVEHIRAIWDFVSTKPAEIPGWVAPETSLLTAWLLTHQNPDAPVLEIGVYKGKYLSVLHEFSGAKTVGYDLFVGAFDPEYPIKEVHNYIASAHGEISSRLH